MILMNLNLGVQWKGAEKKIFKLGKRRSRKQEPNVGMVCERKRAEEADAYNISGALSDRGQQRASLKTPDHISARQPYLRINHPRIIHGIARICLASCPKPIMSALASSPPTVAFTASIIILISGFRTERTRSHPESA